MESAYQRNKKQSYFSKITTMYTPWRRDDIDPEDIDQRWFSEWFVVEQSLFVHK